VPASTTTDSSAPARSLRYRATREPRHDYHIRLPRDWCAVRVPHEPPQGPVCRALGLFVSERDPNTSIEVRCARIANELDPFDLLELHLERDGATAVERNPVASPVGRTGEMLVRRAIPGGAALTLARVEKDGELLYFALAHADADHFPMVEPALREAVGSFRLLRPAGGLAEPLLGAGARLPMDHGFFYPASFRMVRDASSDAALCGYELVHAAAGDEAGFLAAVVIARRETDHENAEEIAGWTRRALCKRGIDLGSMALFEAAPLAGELPARAALGRGRRGEQDVETELVIARHGSAWIILTRAAPLRADNGAAWLANRRAFTILRERFAALPPEDAPRPDTTAQET
jgi:hypothetical protein